MTLTLALLIASMTVNIVCFFVIAYLLDKKAAAHDDNWPMGV